MHDMKRVLIALSLAVSLAAPIAQAADAALEKQAEVLFKEAIDLAATAKREQDPQKLETARQKFAMAYGLSKRPSILFNLALAERNQAKFVDAHRHCTELLRDHAGSPLATDAKRLLDELAKKVGLLRIVAAPPGAELAIDGDFIGVRTPTQDPIAVAPGDHVVEARTGDKKSSTHVTAGIGPTQEVRIPEFKEEPVVAPLVAPSVTITAPVPTPSTKPAESSSVGKTVTSVGLGVVAVAGVTVGIIGAANASSAMDERSALQGKIPAGACGAGGPPQCSDLARVESDRTSGINLARVAFVTAGVASAGLVLTFLFWPKSSPSNAWIAPTLSDRNAGLHFGGAF
jgi:hypothetical protein